MTTSRNLSPRFPIRRLPLLDHDELFQRRVFGGGGLPHLVELILGHRNRGVTVSRLTFLGLG
jgi:hypothetical protein